jgi:hypothetical protein
MPTDHARAVRELFDESEVREVLEGTFYRSEPKVMPLAAKGAEGTRRKRRPAKPKPAHYEIICISMYNEDLARLDDKVSQLKARGHRRMTRSALIRWALDQIELDKVPRGI